MEVVGERELAAWTQISSHDRKLKMQHIRQSKRRGPDGEPSELMAACLQVGKHFAHGVSARSLWMKHGRLN